jgi:hypothetical protein
MHFRRSLTSGTRQGGPWPYDNRLWAFTALVIAPYEIDPPAIAIAFIMYEGWSDRY